MSANQQLPRQFGKYVLVRKIAMGGMAEIFKAKTGGAEGFEKDVVIKRILPHFTEDGDFVKMFIDEAAITSKLQHANIVQIFDFDVCEGSYYIAMELIEGVDLKKVLDVGVKDRKPLSPAQAAWILMETAKGLHYAHVKEHKGQPLNIVHRDISPHNLMVSYNGEVKLMDFGIAKAAQRSTKTMAGTVKGKVAYMSPEQARGKNLDGRSDLFALGIMLWEMLTGKRLFLGDSDFDTLTNVLKHEPVLPSTLNPKVDAQLDDIVLKALAKNRDERHASVEEFARELTKWYYSTVTDLEGESLKRYMHQLFGDDIETNRRLANEERVALGGSSEPEPESNGERTLAMPSADAAKTLLEGDFSAKDLQAALKKQPAPAASKPAPEPAAKPTASQPPKAAANPPRPATPPTAAPAADVQPAKSKAWLWILLLVLLGGGAAAFFALGGSDKPAPKTDATQTSEPGGASGTSTLGDTAELVLEVDPPSATVTVDGKPASGKVGGLKLGSEAKVVVEAEGFARFEKTVAIDSASVKVAVKLEQAREKVMVVLEPVGDDTAEIVVNGKSIGKGATPYNGLAGDVIKVEVRPSRAGVPPVTEEVTLDPALRTKKFALGQAAATLTVTLDPAGAELKSSAGTVAPGASPSESVISGLAAGQSVDITVSKADFDTRKETIAIAGGAQTHTVKLEPKAAAAKPPAGNQPAPTPPAAAAGAKGTLQVKARPWAKVSINGRPVGDAPVSKQMAPGSYTVVLTKGAQSVTKSVRVEAGKTATVNHAFD